MELSIEKYDESEKVGRIKLPNRFIRAFRGQCFENGGFPTRVYFEEELHRYIDSMHANSFETYYKKLCEGITSEEFELLKKCTEDVMTMTKKLYSKTFVVKSPMIAAICQRRILKSVIGEDKNKRVFEIGGGSGILGALLIEDGIKYAATDITQAFYLIQNRIYDYIQKGDLNELVIEDLKEDSRVIHIPYWKLWECRSNPIDADIIMANHAFLEMSQNSIRFYLNYFKKTLEKNDGAIVFQGGGWRVNQNMIDLIELFEDYGYKLQYFDHSKEIVGFSTHGPSLKNQVISELKKLLKRKKETEKIYSLGENLLSRLPKDKIFITGDLGKKINSNLKKYYTMKKVDINEVIKFYDSLEISCLSPDDEFSEYIKVGGK